MSNSLIVFFTFFGFLIFGYLSLLRLAYREYFLGNFLSTLKISFSQWNWLRELGHSTLFFALPATSLLLFWGWGTALLWVLVFHLIFESLIHISIVSNQPSSSDARRLISSQQPILALIERWLGLLFFILIASITITLLTKLIDEQSGLLFALACLLPAQKLFYMPGKGHMSAVKVLGGILFILFGIMLATQLGFSVYGEWSPFKESFNSALSWLRLNNATFIAFILIAAANLQMEDGRIRYNLAWLSGILFIILLIGLESSLLWLQPNLDAPLNSLQSGSAENLPVLLSLCLFLFAGFVAILFRLINGGSTQPISNSQGSNQFGHLQMASLIQLCFTLILILSLASAVGIGAWNTHYLDWSSDLNLFSHLKLSIASISKLSAFAGTLNNYLATILMATVCVFGLSLLMTSWHHLHTLSQSVEPKQTAKPPVSSFKMTLATGVFILSSYFIEHGVGLNVWLFVGILAWVLVVQLLIGVNSQAAQNSTSTKHRLNAGFCIFIIGTGAIQTLWLMIHWGLNKQYVSAVVTGLILCLGFLLWWRSVLMLVKRLTNDDEQGLFNI